MSTISAPMTERRAWRRRRTRQQRRQKTYAFYREIAPEATEDPRWPWQRLALMQYRKIWADVFEQRCYEKQLAALDLQ